MQSFEDVFAKLQDAHMISFGMANGHVIHGKFKEEFGQREIFWLIREEGGSDTILAKRDVCYLRILTSSQKEVQRGQESERDLKDLHGLGTPKQYEGPYAEAINRARSRYRDSEFVAHHPESDGLDSGGRTQVFRPQIVRDENDID